jgi:hypothetical protein
MPDDHAIGLLPHTGWTWLVRVGGQPDDVARHRVVALDVHDAELYHLAREHTGDRAVFVAERRAAALARAIAAVAPHCAGVARAVVLGKQPSLPVLDRIVASHAMIHTAEGDVWRALFAEACAACGVAARRIERPIVHDERWLAKVGQALGAPWTAEVKAAAAAARQELSARRSTACTPTSAPGGRDRARRDGRARARGRAGRSSRP